MEEMTVYELIVLSAVRAKLHDQNFDAVIKVWEEMGKTESSTTLALATIEWAKRNGREIVLVPSKNIKDEGNNERR